MKSLTDLELECFCFLLSCMTEIIHTLSVTTLSQDIRDFKQEDAVKKTRRPNYSNLVNLDSILMEIFLLTAASSRPPLFA